MINKDDTILVQDLTDSFGRQLQWYKELKELVRQMMSKIVLSRGSLAQLSDGMKKKMQLLESIELERRNISGQMALWQDRKSTIRQSNEVIMFEEILQKVTSAISEFLDDEEQLQKYIEGIVSRGSGA